MPIVKNINFESGIRSGDINYNFENIEKEIFKDRLSTSGHGISKGFKMKVLSSESIYVSDGELINKNGDSLKVKGKELYIEEPRYIVSDEEEILTIDSEGLFNLEHDPYSSRLKRFINTKIYLENLGNIELVITSDLNNENINAVEVNNRTIRVDKLYANTKVRVKYLITKDRIDTVFVNGNGNYIVEEGTHSSSVSHVELSKYDNYYLVGFIKININEEITLEVIQDNSSYKRVYVDEDNNLYLNGELYTGNKIIYMEEPKNPMHNDLFYDESVEQLLIYKDSHNFKGWVPINSQLSFPYRETKIFYPEDCPEDLQTFIFGEDELNYKFIPDANQLEIIIDNSPLMSDQFEEITKNDGKEYENIGIGFRLINPLNRATTVEARVMHSIETFPIRRTFQRTATFVTDGFDYYRSDNINKVFKTLKPYVYGESQLEVFHNGERLERGYEFSEMLNVNSTKVGKVNTDVFAVNKELKPGDRISYKITHNVYSYDNVDLFVGEIKNIAEKSIEKSEKNSDSLNILSENTKNEFNSVKEKINIMENNLPNISEYLRTDDIIKEDNLSQEIKSKMFSKKLDLTLKARAENIIENVKASDMFFVFYIDNEGNSNILIDRKDYEIRTADNQTAVRLILVDNLVNQNCELYIKCISLG